jgi:NAD(P)-dependent dehydrogenase (short-subunit alcohol dehydrogenase family)
VRRTFDTNFFATLAVTQAMLPLLKRSMPGRIVSPSSDLGSLAIIGDWIRNSALSGSSAMALPEPR